MRAPAILLGLLTLGACAKPELPDNIFAVFFGNASAELDSQAQGVVARAAAAARQHPTLPVGVAGYADPNPVPDVPVQLSVARADAVAALLVSDGVSPARIKRRAVGAAPDTEPGIASRRVEIDIGDN